MKAGVGGGGTGGSRFRQQGLASKQPLPGTDLTRPPDVKVGGGSCMNLLGTRIYFLIPGTVLVTSSANSVIVRLLQTCF